jgi:hypothetical protein
VFGPGPFVVVRCVDHSDHGLASGLILRTALGEHEIPEVWLALVAAPGSGSRSQAVSRQASKSGGANTKRPRAARPPAPRNVPG